MWIQDLQEHIFRLIVRGAMRQGPAHEGNTRHMFRIMREEWAREFTEDNRYTQEHHLNELFEESKAQ